MLKNMQKNILNIMLHILNEYLDVISVEPGVSEVDELLCNEY